MQKRLGSRSRSNPAADNTPMTVQLTDGQDFAHFTLIERVADNGNADLEHWVALDRDVNQRVLLTVFHHPLGPDLIDKCRARIERSRGLIHQHILRLYEFSETDGTCYLSQQYVRDTRPLDLSNAPFRQVWPTLRTLMNTLTFAHDLGFAHGQLHPENLLIDPSGDLHIRDFGLPSELIVTPDAVTLQSPDHGKSGAPDAADDTYACGCLIHQSLTGHLWPTEHAFESSVPIAPDVRAAVESMLRPSAYDRSRDLNHIQQVLSAHVDRGNSSLDITPASFARTKEEQPGTLPPGGARHQPARERQQISTLLALVAFVGLLGLAAIVFFLLPEPAITPPAAPVAESRSPAVQSSPKTGVPATEPEEPELAPMEIARLELAREQGKEAASTIIRLQVELEDVGVALWAQDRFEALVEQAISGDQQYREGDYEQSLEVYQSVIAGLRELQESVPAVLAETVTEGDRALAEGDVQTALRSFAIATAIEGDDPELQQKLTRAENLGEVISLVSDGEQAEREADLDLALEKLQAAAALDREWEPASQGVNRVRLAIRKRNFDDAMSTGFSALAGKAYEQARDAFAKASEIMPSSREAEDGLLQIELAERMDRIEQMKGTAESHLRDGSWRAAVDAYSEILEIDDALVFARQGLATANERLALDTELQQFIDNPTLMQEDQALQEARSALIKASRIDDSQPRLKEQIDRLSFLISAARVPVDVTITSDARTDITVYRVGALGRLDRTSLELYPGRYTIVGKRRGYRDVQQELLVIPRTPPGSVHISCSEKI